MQRKMRIFLTFLVLLTCAAFAANAEQPIASASDAGCQTGVLEAIWEEPIMTPVTEVDSHTMFQPVNFGCNSSGSCTAINMQGRRCSGSSVIQCTTADNLCSFCICQFTGFYMCLT